MATYVMLAHFTERGIMNVKNTATRAEEFKQMATSSSFPKFESYQAAWSSL
jgi:uncharacterized protein with GYD domain